MKILNKTQRIICLLTGLLSLTGCDILDKFSFNKSSTDEESNSGESSSVSNFQFSSKYSEFNQITKLEKTYQDFFDNNIYNLSNIPSLGTVKFLVIPIWFNDSSQFIHKRNNVWNDVKDAYFGSNETTGWRSVKTYYEELSSNKLSIEGYMAPWYETNYSYKDFKSETNYSVLISAVNNYFLNNNISRKSFDTNNDSYLDAVAFVYGAPNYGCLNNDDYSNLWAYTSWTQDSNQKSSSKPGLNCFSWSSYDFIYQWNTDTENRVGTPYGIGFTEHCNIDTHTYIHETGHMFGLQDYYDYNRDDALRPAGGFSMQDENVGSHDPFSCLSLGWAEAYIPTENCYIKLNPFQESRKVIILSNDFNHYSSPFDEYLMLEFYTATGLNLADSISSYRNYYPTGPYDMGIRLWHVDSRLMYYNGTYGESMVTADPSTSLGTVYHATSNSSHSDASFLGSRWSKYDILHLIRANQERTVFEKSSLESDDLFLSGSSFSRIKYKKQFVTEKCFDNGQLIGWSFKVTIDSESENPVAYIECIKG